LQEGSIWNSFSIAAKALHSLSQISRYYRDVYSFKRP